MVHLQFMATITFDTHKFIRRLQASGMPEEQAEAITDAFKDAQSEAVATRRDLKELEIKLEAKLDRLDAKFTGEFTLIKWMMGLLLGGVVALILKAFFPV